MVPHLGVPVDFGMKRIGNGRKSTWTSPIDSKFRCESVRDDGRPPKQLFWTEAADFRTDFFGRFSVHEPGDAAHLLAMKVRCP